MSKFVKCSCCNNEITIDSARLTFVRKDKNGLFYKVQYICENCLEKNDYLKKTYTTVTFSMIELLKEI